MTTTNNRPKVLIIGDGQAKETGKLLADLLKKKGYDLTTDEKTGRASAVIVNELQARKSLDSFVKVIVFCGGNDMPGELVQQNATKVAELCGGDRLIWVGPPPATTIKDLKVAAKQYPKVNQAEYWEADGTMANREAVNTQLAAALAKTAAKYIDWRKLDLGGEAQRSGVVFPTQMDGIHVTGTPAEHAAQAIATAMDGAKREEATKEERKGKAGWIFGGAALLLGVALYKVVKGGK